RQAERRVGVRRVGGGRRLELRQRLLEPPGLLERLAVLEVAREGERGDEQRERRGKSGDAVHGGFLAVRARAGRLGVGARFLQRTRDTGGACPTPFSSRDVPRGYRPPFDRLKPPQCPTEPTQG